MNQIKSVGLYFTLLLLISSLDISFTNRIKILFQYFMLVQLVEILKKQNFHSFLAAIGILIFVIIDLGLGSKYKYPSMIISKELLSEVSFSNYFLPSFNINMKGKKRK
jgi:hypothetical protein